jgi:hypothetical protein
MLIALLGVTPTVPYTIPPPPPPPPICEPPPPPLPTTAIVTDETYEGTLNVPELVKN